MKIYPNNPNLQYTGRIDFSDACAPVFVFPCTHVSIRFTEETLRVYVSNRSDYWNNYLGCILDGAQSAWLLPKNGQTSIDIPVHPTAAGIHEVTFFKRQDSCHELTFLGLELADNAQVLPLPEKPQLCMEVYGDSVSAGEVSEAVNYVAKSDPIHQGEYSNSWYSYAWMTARKLNAQIHNIAQGGIALLDGTGWFCAPDYVGMEQMWDKVHYNPHLGKATPWNFENYTPQIVVVAIGQNDSHPDNYMAEEFHGQKAEKWRRHYRQFLQNLRNVYPNAWIICCTTLLCHELAWDRTIEEICQTAADDKIVYFPFKRAGIGTPGHLRIPEAKEMAEELAAYIQQTILGGI